jgi:hypothetical protein
MFLFARWISTCYADEHIDEQLRYVDNPDFDSSTAMSVLNREDGEWWKKQLIHFNEVVYPNYLENGSVKNTEDFLSEVKPIQVKKIVPVLVEAFDPDGYSLGFLNEFEFNDLRIQIMEKKASGYYMMFKNERIDLYLDGTVSNWAEGFYDIGENQLGKILNLRTSMHSTPKKGVNWQSLRTKDN